MVNNTITCNIYSDRNYICLGHVFSRLPQDNAIVMTYIERSLTSGICDLKHQFKIRKIPLAAHLTLGKLLNTSETQFFTPATWER